MHAKDRRDAIADLELVRCPVQSHVGEDVDESGCHDLPAGVDGPAPPDVIRGNRLDAVPQDAHVSDLVPPLLRVDDPPPYNHDVIEFLSDGRRRQSKGEEKHGDQKADAHVSWTL